MKQLVWMLACSFLFSFSLRAGEIEELSGETMVLRQGDTVVRIAPSQGGNVYSISVRGIEYLHGPKDGLIAGVRCGVPVLYPTPNRVKNAQFRFRNRVVRFKPNAGKNFIHGLVNKIPWVVQSTSTTKDSCSITLMVDFAANQSLGELFPFAHQLIMRIEVFEDSVKWTYQVDNRNGKQAVPFGFALHPYFKYQGKSESTFLTIPADSMMESVQRLPTGKLIPKSKLDLPLGRPFSLKALQLDDVFFGIEEDGTTVIDFRDRKRRIEITTSSDFTHLVVWTPDRPYFGVESQTCSTDAHNLDDAGMKKQAHLQICEPEQVVSGWVRYRFFQEDRP